MADKPVAEGSTVKRFLNKVREQHGSSELHHTHVAESIQRLVNQPDFESLADHFTPGKASQITLRGVLPRAPELNPIEQRLWDEASLIERTGLALSGLRAKEYAEDRYETAAIFRGNGDALRHAVWNCLMTKWKNAAWAKMWADAHEDGAIGQPALEKEMDLFNNEVGRMVAATVGSFLSDESADKVQAKVRRGELKRIVNDVIVSTDGSGER